MTGDTNNLGHLVRRLQVDSLADRRLSWKELAREDFVNDHNERRVFIVLRSKETPCAQWRPHCSEVVWIHDVIDRPIHVVVIGRLWLSFQPEQQLVVIFEGRSARRLRDCRNTRNGSQPAIKLAEVSTDRSCAGTKN